MDRQRFQARRRLRLLPYLEHEPDTRNHVGQRNGLRHTHGGTVSAQLALFIFMHVLPLWRPIYDPFTFIDCGCGSGIVCFIVSAISTTARNCFGIDIDTPRVDRANLWRSRIIAALNHLYNFPIHHFLPVFRVGDFTNLDTPFFRYAIDNRSVIYFCNNYDGVWLDHGIQTMLEHNIGRSRVGSIVISLDRMFRHDLSWHEEIFVTEVQRCDLSWTANSSPEGYIPLYIFKYTKRGSETQQRRLRSDLDRATRISFTV